MTKLGAVSIRVGMKLGKCQGHCRPPTRLPPAPDCLAMAPLPSQNQSVTTYFWPRVPPSALAYVNAAALCVRGEHVKVQPLPTLSSRAVSGHQEAGLTLSPSPQLGAAFLVLALEPRCASTLEMPLLSFPFFFF